jgi:alkanesulfonate monooxygenase SsuD/methylene tetrahydromethanopterin reductase-like flavin-dependent oxidoreductase (luciferase family)
MAGVVLARVSSRSITTGALPGPARVHDISIWVGAFKPRMPRLVGRLADGRWPTIAGLKPGDLAAGNAVIDAAATRAGREPNAIRRAPEPASSRARARDGRGTRPASLHNPRGPECGCEPE